MFDNAKVILLWFLMLVIFAGGFFTGKNFYEKPDAMTNVIADISGSEGISQSVKQDKHYVYVNTRAEDKGSSIVKIKKSDIKPEYSNTIRTGVETLENRAEKKVWVELTHRLNSRFSVTGKVGRNFIRNEEDETDFAGTVQYNF